MLKPTPSPLLRGAALLRALTRSSATDRLPLRVAEIVRRKDRESEQLLCRVQLLLAATLFLLYALAPRPPDAAMTFLSPVPLALAAYTALTLLRSAHVRKASLPNWAVAVSIVADVTLLLLLIWSFHWTYNQPPAFSLKAPTFVYLFVFVVIRALRFDFRYVLLAGAAASAGWLLLTLAALTVSEQGTVTRSFTHYILANRILIGAEFDKIFALAVVTAVLSIAAWRAERTLVLAVREETANREVGRFLSRGVADQIARADSEVVAGAAMERDAAIMFLDIRGFTKYSKNVPPSDVVAMLTSFHARVVPIVRAHDGVVDKFLGDGVMITFGGVAASAQAAADALRALEALLESAASWQDEVRSRNTQVLLEVNAAVAYGRVVFATVGDHNRLEYTVIGEAVNIAAKLEKHNKTEDSVAVTTMETLQRAIEQGYKPARASHVRRRAHVDGVAGPLDLAVWRGSAR